MAPLSAPWCHRLVGGPLAVVKQQGVDQGGDLIQVELGRCVGVEHGCVVDVVDPPGQCRFDRQLLDVDVRSDESGDLLSAIFESPQM